jgi:osmotically-inducible protein OsmY
MKHAARALLIVSLATSSILTSGCFPLAATGVVMGARALTDRRTVGAQAEDQGIELKASAQLRDAMRYPGGISVTSYNRRVLLTGQVANAEDKRRAEQIVGRIDNVRAVHNELQIAGQPGITATAADTTTTTAVKLAFAEDKEIPAGSIKIVTESGAVFLMGLVTQNEAQKAARVASRVRGVQRVVTVFEIISDAERDRVTKQADEKK